MIFYFAVSHYSTNLGDSVDAEFYWPQNRALGNTDHKLTQFWKDSIATETHWVLPDKYDLNKSKTEPSKSRRITWSIVSNAAVRSSSTTNTPFFWSTAFIMSWWTLKISRVLFQYCDLLCKLTGMIQVIHFQQYDPGNNRYCSHLLPFKTCWISKGHFVPMNAGIS